MPSVHLEAFGCQMNTFDAETVRGAFLDRGWTLATDPGAADCALLLTCSVRDGAEERIRGRLGALQEAKRNRPGLRVGILGCMAQRDGEAILDQFPVLDLVAGTRQFTRVPDLIDAVEVTGRPVLDLGTEGDPMPRVRTMAGRDPGGHAFVPVMRGCDLNCTYCIVPAVRGRVVSRDEDDVVEEVRRLVGDGVVEVTLLGQTVNSYGWERPRGRRGLGALLGRLASVAGLEWIRLVTLHPSYLDENLCAALADLPHLAGPVPLPAQSGSDRILRQMKRGYTTDLYRRRLEMLRTAVPGVEITSDWIVGFPGETAEEASMSEGLLAEIAPLKSYVFRYSPRPGTAADGLSDDVPETDKAVRNTALLKAQSKAAGSRAALRTGALMDVRVAGSSRRPGCSAGLSREGFRVWLPEGLAAGTRLDVEVTGADGAALVGLPIG